MTAFHSAIPPKSKEFENQTELSSLTDDDLELLSRPFASNIRILAYQVLCFLLLLGPVRLIFSLIIALFTVGLILLIRLPMHALGMPTKCRGPCVSIARFGIRCLLFAFGVAFMQVNGSCEPTARFVVANRVSLLDALVIFTLQDCTAPVDFYYRSYRLLELLLEALRPVWIDGGRAAAAQAVISGWADNFKRPPILVFPEGAVGGAVLLRFAHTAFATPYRMQVVALRYHMLGVPGWNTYAYRGERPMSVLWRLFAMPPAYVSVHFLKAITMGTEGKADIATGEISIERLPVSAQLMIANHLGVKAVDRTAADSNL
jgi:hypothetical protein